MKSLKDYISESEAWIDTPTQGDEFDIELAPDHLIETYVIESTDDSIVIAGDEHVINLLESHGHVTEDIARYGAVGSSRGMGYTLDEHGGGIGPKQHWQDLMPEEQGTFRDEDGGEDEDDLDEGRMKDLDIAYQDYKKMNPQKFKSEYGIDRDSWFAKNRDMLPTEQEYKKHDDWFGRVLELAGVADEKFDKQDDVYHEDQDAAVLAQKEIDTAITNPMPGVHEEEEVDLDEAEYQGRKVPLGKPMRGDVKKFKVYVKDPSTGNIKKVNFGHGGTSAKRLGQKTMKIKKSNPARRKSFRARHNCDNPGPRTKARYWSCRAW